MEKIIFLLSNTKNWEAPVSLLLVPMLMWLIYSYMFILYVLYVDKKLFSYEICRITYIHTYSHVIILQ